MERNVTLDFIRGIAVLGILLLNIVAFGLPKAAYLNPAWYDAITPSDAWTWALMDVFAQVKFLTLFALLFGAGLQMLLVRGKRWIQSRLTLLMLLGLLHGLLLWEGDILLAYALVGLIFWRSIRDASGTQSLFNTGALLYLIGVVVLVLLGMLSDPGPNSFWNPDLASLHDEQVWRNQGGLEAMSHRADLLISSLIALVAQYGWQLAGMMMMGAALMRNGWLKGQFSPRHYRRTGCSLIALGVLINLPAIIAQWQLNWEYRWCGLLLQAPRELSAPFQAIGYTALILGFWQQLAHLPWVHWVSCVGRMALTNYLLQTVICTTVFYHFGFFMQFDRLSLLALVPAVWGVNIIISLLWLHYFRQGPVEGLWRHLTRYVSGEAARTVSENDVHHRG